MNFKDFLQESKDLNDLTALVQKIADKGDLNELMRNLVHDDHDYLNTDDAIEDLVKYFKVAKVAHKEVLTFAKKNLGFRA